MEKIGKPQNSYLKCLGSRILCELNDLKRTPESAAIELGYSIDELKLVLSGESTEQKAHDLIRKMGQQYPIDHLQLHLLKDDTLNGIKFVSAIESKNSSRIYDRVDKDGNMSQYYEYRDTAMSKLSLFKPEWISVLREVKDSNPHNPDVVMNNGHFMHQVTLFIGPVNFYYEDSFGTRHCFEMNTGDSNYITPFIKHSFTSRDKDKFTCILAVTFGADICRSQRELYALGQTTLERYAVNSTKQLIEQHMKNNLFTIDILDSLVKKQGINIKEILSDNKVLTQREQKIIANALGVNPSDICKAAYDHEPDCVIKHIDNNKPMLYSSERNKIYNIYPLAKTLKVPSMTNSILEVLSNKHDIDNCLQTSLHSYVINFNNAPVELMWEHNNKIFTKILQQYDSVYLKPFIKFSFVKKTNKKSALLIVGIPSSINSQAQKELSCFAEPNRVINELETWYDY